MICVFSPSARPQTSKIGGAPDPFRVFTQPAPKAAVTGDWFAGGHGRTRQNPLEFPIAAPSTLHCAPGRNPHEAAPSLMARAAAFEARRPRAGPPHGFHRLSAIPAKQKRRTRAAVFQLGFVARASPRHGPHRLADGVRPLAQTRQRSPEGSSPFDGSLRPDEPPDAGAARPSPGAPPA
jgi:hypothetical protein